MVHTIDTQVTEIYIEHTIVKTYQSMAVECVLKKHILQEKS